MVVRIESSRGKGSEWSAIDVLISHPYLPKEPVYVRNFGCPVWGLHTIELDKLHDLPSCDIGG